jgi:hypothetical protein
VLSVTGDIRKSWKISSKSVSSTYFPDYCAPPIQFAPWTLLKERLILAVRTSNVEMRERWRAGILERGVEARVCSFERDERARSCERPDWWRERFFRRARFFSLHWLIFVIKATAMAERSVTRCARRPARRGSSCSILAIRRANRSIDRKIGRLSKRPIA